MPISSWLRRKNFTRPCRVPRSDTGTNCRCTARASTFSAPSVWPAAVRSATAARVRGMRPIERDVMPWAGDRILRACTRPGGSSGPSDSGARGDDVQIRAKAKQQAATTGGIVIDTRARFGYTAAPGTTDDARLRHLTIALPPECAARLFAARDAGGTEQQLRDITAEGLQEICSRTAAAAPRACWWSSPTWSRWTSTCSGAHSAHAQGPPGPTPRAVEHRKLAVQ